MRYRKEIDGLRAIAVLSVIFYHAGFLGFSGGFVGVDVFFVISGYLITTIIMNDLESNSFSLVSFYERRARRILPALFVMMLVITPFVWVWVLPEDMKIFSDSLIAVPLFISNFLFCSYVSYFDFGSELKPLLHTWSLAVEEQYYLLFPLLLMIIWTCAKNQLLPLLLLLLIASLITSEITLKYHPEVAFYMLHTRAWELLIGALLATNAIKKGISKIKYADGLSILGLSMIVASIISYNKNIFFPGLYALLPTLGAALIIAFATNGTHVYKLLSSRALVFIGLISYSLYLWHYPIFTLARHRLIEEPSSFIFLSLILLSIGISYISWRYIEKPCRDKSIIPRSKILTPIALCVVCFFSFGLIGDLTKGYTVRFDERILNASVSKFDPITSCKIWDHREKGGVCFAGDRAKEPTIALIGDSHSIHLYPALDEALQNAGVSGLVYSQNACTPLIGLRTDNPFCNIKCMDFVLWAMEEVSSNKEIHTVILSSKWSQYIIGHDVGEEGKQILYYDALSKNLSRDENYAVFKRGLERTREKLTSANKRVIIVSGIPEYDVILPHQVGKSILFNNTDKLSPNHLVSYDAYSERNKLVKEVFDDLDVKRWSDIIDSYKILCDEAVCRYLDSEGRILYVDDEHLSYYGAKMIVSEIIKRLRSAT